MRADGLCQPACLCAVCPAALASPPPCSFNVANYKWYHDISLAIFTESSVYSNGRAFDMNIDSHRGGAWVGGSAGRCSFLFAVLNCTCSNKHHCSSCLMPRCAAALLAAVQARITTCSATSTWAAASAASRLVVHLTVVLTVVGLAAAATVSSGMRCLFDGNCCISCQTLRCMLCLLPPPSAAANVTWWNLYTSNGAPIKLPECDFGPHLYFAGNWLSPSKPNNGRRLMQADAALEGGVPAPAPAPEAAEAADAEQAGAPSQAEPGVSAAASDGGAVRGTAMASTPNWCAKQRWRVDLVGSGKQLYPADLAGAMVAARKNRRAFL